MEKFDLEYQYQLYLKRVDLKESMMHEQQKVETKRAFMGACGQLLILLRDDIAALEENKAIEVMEGMVQQVGDFFLKESGRLN